MAHGQQVNDESRSGISPLVSVVIPAYQAHQHIARALESVFAQTFRDFEIIVVNDGSPETPLLEEALQNYRGRVRYIEQENQGPSGARNRAILEARGQWVAFLDSDDSWLPDHLEKQMKLLSTNPALDLAYADSVLVRDDKPIGRAFQVEAQHPPVTFEALLCERCTVATSTTVARRQVVIDAGLFDKKFRRCEDFDLWLRMAFRGAKMDFVSEPGVFHYLTENSLASDNYLLKRARIEVYEKTATTLRVTGVQAELIRSLIDRTEAECQKDNLKRLLDDGDYAGALNAALRARTLTGGGWKLNAAVIGLRWLPGVFRSSHQIHRWWIEMRARSRWTQAGRKLTAPPRPTQVH